MKQIITLLIASMLMASVSVAMAATVKSQELKAKEEEPNRKINDVLPFANAVMNVQKES